MAVNIHKLIAAIAPDYYCKKEKRDEVKKIAKEEGYLKAAEKAEVVDTDFMDLEVQRRVNNPFKFTLIKNPIEKHSMSYDVFSQALEPIYYWILNYMTLEYTGSDKLMDNFLTSPGSAQFGELGARATRMQEEAMKMLASANNVFRSVLNIIYDLKEFKMTLAPYDDLNSKDNNKKNSAYLSLKQKWMDMVDIRKGNGAINVMAQQLDFVTLRDAFMMSNSIQDVKKLDLNDRVKRILEIKVSEFLNWLKQSESELRKRYEIEKIYLKSQINSLKLYSNWAKPYLKTARALEQKAAPTSALVNTFNSTILELTLLGKCKFKISKLVDTGILPKFFLTISKKKCIPITIIEFNFTSSPERMTQAQHSGYGYRGKVNIDFTSYALDENEIKVLKKEMEKDDLGDLMSALEGVTVESLEKIQVDIDEFLEDKKKEKEEKKSEDTNPFSALFSFFKIKKTEEKNKDELQKDTYEEKVIRDGALLKGRVDCRKMYNAYKSSNSMPTF